VMFSRTYRYEAVVNTAAWDSKLGNNSKFISGFVELEQMNAVGEDLPALQQGVQ
jgi:hypothetical protein